MDKLLRIVTIGVLAVLIIAIIFYIKSSKILDNNIDMGGEISLSGHATCVADSSQGTCLLGLKDKDGRYFELRDTDPALKNISYLPTEKVINIKGILISGGTTSQSVGVVSVSNVEIE